MAVKMDKMQSKYIEQYMIIGRTGTMTYHLDLSKEFSSSYDMFHMFLLNKIVEYLMLIVPLLPEDLRSDLSAH